MTATGPAAPLICGVLSLAAALLALGPAHAQRGPDGAAPSGVRITVSCQRYISSQVIWDRPTGIFVEDLQKAGYPAAEALAVATTICRDERLVGDNAGLGEAMRRYLRDNPPG